jgi:hypothetical protein
MHVIICFDVLSGVITKHEMEEFKTNAWLQNMDIKIKSFFLNKQ